MDPQPSSHRTPPADSVDIAAGFEDRPRKVLVCDDERHIVRLIQVNLERQGYQVAVAYDGRECLEKIAADRPDLCVLDVMMPHLDGFQVLKAIRLNPDTADLPVIMLTAKAQDQDVFEKSPYDADLYLTKSSFDLKALIEAWRKRRKK